MKIKNLQLSLVSALASLSLIGNASVAHSQVVADTFTLNGTTRQAGYTLGYMQSPEVGSGTYAAGGFVFQDSANGGNVTIDATGDGAAAEIAIPAATGIVTVSADLTPGDNLGSGFETIDLQTTAGDLSPYDASSDLFLLFNNVGNYYLYEDGVTYGIGGGNAGTAFLGKDAENLVSLTYNTLTDTASININGTAEASYTLTEPLTGTIAAAGFTIQSTADTDTTSYVDNFAVTEAPEPPISTLFLTGAILMLGVILRKRFAASGL
jgi:hypothetical protein